MVLFLTALSSFPVSLIHSLKNISECYCYKTVIALFYYVMRRIINDKSIKIALTLMELTILIEKNRWQSKNHMNKCKPTTQINARKERYLVFW